MKTAFPWSGIALAVIFFLALGFRPASALTTSSAIEGNPELPDSVMKVIQKACLDCHGADGNSMAKMHLNIAKWNTYNAKKQAGKASDISKEVSKSAMPPDKWRKNNPDNVPSQADVDLLKNWASALNK